MIVKKTKTVEREVMKTPQRVEYHDTGEVEAQVKVNDLGITERIEVPIKKRVIIQATYETILEKVEYWSINDGTDEHEFMSELDAKQFAKGIK